MDKKDCDRCAETTRNGPEGWNGWTESVRLERAENGWTMVEENTFRGVKPRIWVFRKPEELAAFIQENF